jgi:hypothetical protein
MKYYGLSPLLSAAAADLDRLNIKEWADGMRERRGGVVIADGSSEAVGSKKVEMEHDPKKCECRKGFITITCVEWSNALFAAQETQGDGNEETAGEDGKDENDDENLEGKKTPTASEFGDEYPEDKA